MTRKNLTEPKRLFFVREKEPVELIWKTGMDLDPRSRAKDPEMDSYLSGIAKY
jgi:hypothetical protein